MPEQIKKLSPTKQPENPAVEDTVADRGNTKNLTAELDNLLDEIDAVLESNAEEFVKSYVQKGGQ